MKIAILSDIHANIDAFDACLRDAEDQGVDLLLGLGDLVGYGPDPQEAVERAMEVGLSSVMGNHDHAVNSVAAERWFNPDAKTVVAMTRRLLEESALEFLAALPVSMEMKGGLLVHGFPPASFKTYIFMVPPRGIARVLSSIPQEVVFVGHTHELALYTLRPEASEVEEAPLGRGGLLLEPRNRYIVNCGAVGQPRDGDPRAKYLIWRPEERELEVRFVEYPVEDVARRIIERGFPTSFAERLFGRRRP